MDAPSNIGRFSSPFVAIRFRENGACCSNEEVIFTVESL